MGESSKRWQRRGERIKELYSNGGNISSNGHQVVENLVPHKKVIISSGRHMNTFDVIEKKYEVQNLQLIVKIRN